MYLAMQIKLLEEVLGDKAKDIAGVLSYLNSIRQLILDEVIVK